MTIASGENFRESRSHGPLLTWQAFTVRLVMLSVASIVVAPLLVRYAKTPDGSDAFYVGIAWQFAVWGVIDLGFALNGFREINPIRKLDPSERDQVSARKAENILRVLKTSRWQNAIWLVLGAITLTAGYLFHSASAAGHGVGVILQAMLLVMFDRSFSAALSRSLHPG